MFSCKNGQRSFSKNENKSARVLMCSLRLLMLSFMECILYIFGFDLVRVCKQSKKSWISFWFISYVVGCGHAYKFLRGKLEWSVEKNKRESSCRIFKYLSYCISDGMIRICGGHSWKQWPVVKVNFSQARSSCTK